VALEAVVVFYSGAKVVVDLQAFDDGSWEIFLVLVLSSVTTESREGGGARRVAIGVCLPSIYGHMRSRGILGMYQVYLHTRLYWDLTSILETSIMCSWCLLLTPCLRHLTVLRT
jgi:hypothetical protein